MTFLLSGQDVVNGAKRCTRCSQTLPLDSFAPKPKLSSGFDSWCRPCRAENLRAWRAKRRAAAA
jgi:hypothetical protein